MTTPDTDLMALFDFTADDLQANRAGSLTPDQEARLGQIDAPDGTNLACALILVAFTAAMCTLCAILADVPIILRAVDWPPLTLILPVLALLALVIGWRWRQEIRLNPPVDSSALGTVQGRIKLRVQDHGAREDYYLVVIDAAGEETALPIPWTALDGLREHQRKNGADTIYRVYYALRGPVVLSLEVI